MTDWKRSSQPCSACSDGCGHTEGEDRPTKAVDEAQAELDCLIESLSVDTPEPPITDDERADPLYLIISSRGRLTKKYGQLGFSQLARDLRELKDAIEGHTDLEAMIVYVDDTPSLASRDIQPVDPTNPWQIKMLVDHLDVCLAKRGQEIRYLLIVGGDSIIPFHRLPNPVADHDADVPSDNPYASRDANYLIPERAVGRLPDGEGEGLGLLHSLIKTSIAAHQKPSTQKGLLSSALGALWSRDRDSRDGCSLGYTASIWRKASRAVFQVIGDNHDLRTSPPLTYKEFQVGDRPHFSYFNLHGVEDGANWYGQRDSLFPAEYPLFPVALRPHDLTTVEHADSVIFTEACYGANILGKDTSSSMALRFLASQALAVIGSTKASYGSIAPPLLGADLMGHSFWEGLQAHLTTGEALKYAKVNLAKQMQDRQDYLDSEDQKTLMSFVLYGDPSLPDAGHQDGEPADSQAPAFCPPLVCGRTAKVRKSPVSKETVAKVKKRIEVSLPHMADARVRATPIAFCSEECGEQCSLGLKSRATPTVRSAGWAFTLEKQVSIEGDGTHRQLVRVTVDGSGHVLKMAVSK